MFFSNDTATTDIYTLSLHDALPILCAFVGVMACSLHRLDGTHRGPPITILHRRPVGGRATRKRIPRNGTARRSEEHTSELQSRQYLVCRLLLEKKKNR